MAYTTENVYSTLNGNPPVRVNRRTLLLIY